MKKSQKQHLAPEALEVHRGKTAGYTAAIRGAIKRIKFTDKDNSPNFINAYNEAYEKAAAASPEEREKRRGKYAGKQAANKGFLRKAPFKPGTSPHYIQGYVEAYDRGVCFLKTEKSRGKRLGYQSGFYGYNKKDFTHTNKSSDYIDSYNEGYEKAYARFLALSFQEKEKRIGRNGRRAAGKGHVRTHWDGCSPEYKEAYNLKRSTQANAEYSAFDSQSVQPISTYLKETNEPMRLGSNNLGNLDGEVRHLESNNSQPQSSSCPALPLFLIKSLENCLLSSLSDYNQAFSLQQGLADATILEALYLRADTLDEETAEIPLPELDASGFLNNEPANSLDDLKQDQFPPTELYHPYQGSSRNLLFFSQGSSISLQENETNISDPSLTL